MVAFGVRPEGNPVDTAVKEAGFLCFPLTAPFRRASMPVECHSIPLFPEILMRAIRTLFVAVFALAVATSGCASSGSGGGPASTGGNPNVISRAQLDQLTTSDLYDAIRRLRPNWLTARGSTTLIGEQAQVAVYMNGSRLGGPGVLRGIDIDGVTSVEYLSPSDATNRYGTDHMAGVIVIRSR